MKGVLQPLPAEAFSVKPGGEIAHLLVGGSLVTSGNQVTTYVVEGGTVGDLRVAGHILATGAASNAIEVKAGGRTPLANISARAEAGETPLNTGGTITDQADFAQK